MIIPTKYNVGHKFWVPRCYEVYEKEELRFEDEVWYRDVSHFKAFAKQKVIIKIEIYVSDSDRPVVHYYTVNTDEEANTQLSSVYEESRINDYTEEQALSVAKEYERKQEAYYGL